LKIRNISGLHCHLKFINFRTSTKLNNQPPKYVKVAFPKMLNENLLGSFCVWTDQRWNYTNTTRQSV